MRTRRQLLGATAAAASLLALASCAGQSVATVSQKVVTDVNTLADALTAALPGLQTVLGVSTAAAANVATLVKQIAAAAAGVAVTVSQNIGQSIVQQIATDFAALQTALSGFNMPANLQQVIAAASVLLPVIEAAVGLFAAAAPAGSMSADQARDKLLLFITSSAH